MGVIVNAAWLADTRLPIDANLSEFQAARPPYGSVRVIAADVPNGGWRGALRRAIGSFYGWTDPALVDGALLVLSDTSPRSMELSADVHAALFCASPAPGEHRWRFIDRDNDILLGIVLGIR